MQESPVSPLYDPDNELPEVNTEDKAPVDFPWRVPAPLPPPPSSVADQTPALSKRARRRLETGFTRPRSKQPRQNKATARACSRGGRRA